MFRVEYLKVLGHPQLGELELFLSDIEEINNFNKPYTSVIIGPNGTGKSFILRTISDILTQFCDLKEKKISSVNIPYYIHIRYKLNDDYFEFIYSYSNLTAKSNRRIYSYYKNRPFTEFDSTPFLMKEYNNFKIDLKEVLFPKNLIVNSVMLTDRFLFKKSEPQDFYQYLGVRSTSSTASTKSAVKGVIEKLFSESISNDNFLINLKELLSFLDFEKQFEVEYNTKLNKLFFIIEKSECVKL